MINVSCLKSCAARNGLSNQGMMMGKQRQNLVQEQGMKRDAGSFSEMRNDYQVRAIFFEKSHRIRMESGDQVQIDLGPVLAKRIHRRHQPVETRMAFHGDSQEPGLALSDPGKIVLRVLSPPNDFVSQLDEKLTGGGQAERIAFALKDINCVVCLDRSYLVGHRRLGKIQSLSGLGEVARFGQGDQRFQMTKFQHRAPFGYKFYE